jgi:hypothetical protein
VSNPASRNVLENCGFQWTGVALHRFEVLGSSAPVDAFRLSRSAWSWLKSWAGVALPHCEQGLTPVSAPRWLLDNVHV